MRRQLAKLAGAACLSAGIVCAGGMVFTPLDVYAQEAEETQEDEVIGKDEQELVKSSDYNNSTAFSGKFGKNNNLRWTYNEATKTITVTGEDYMYGVNTYSGISYPCFNPKAEHIVFKNCHIMDANLQCMFYNMVNLKDIDFSGLDIISFAWEASNGYINIHSMFYNCKSLRTIDFTNMNIDFSEHQVYSLWGLFYGCTSLERIDMSNIKIVNYERWNAGVDNMFNNCTNLKILKTPQSIPDGVEVEFPKAMLENDGTTYHTRLSQNNQGMTLKSRDCNGWSVIDGKYYWYEDAVRQGTEGRGKEIYDPDSDAWYWLDAVQDGAMAVSKDVYQESFAGQWGDIPGEDGVTYGKWVRYDSEGHMVKGWANSSDGKGFNYFDQITGAMVKGWANIDGADWYFDEVTGVAHANGWDNVDGKEYWYENGVKQGTEGRGKEIYDPDSDAWYWLDAVQGGAKAVSKDVYQESNGGKWVRYDSKGMMIKGWSTSYVNGRSVKYYFDPITGAMAKGWVNIDGNSYYFDETTGIYAGK